MDKKINDFFFLAKEWNMNWKSWKYLFSKWAGIIVLDDDSGLDDPAVYTADKVKIGISKCTLISK